MGSDAVLSVKLSTGTASRLFFTVADLGQFKAILNHFVFILAASCANLLPKWGAKMGVKSGTLRHQKIDMTKDRSDHIHKNCCKNWLTFSSFLEQFWLPFLGPMLIPKLVQNLLIVGSILDPFFLGFRSSLGASWEPSWAS